jgi:hypothetical protein
VIKWWVDASYAVHDDMKSHTGGIMTMGKGVVYADASYAVHNDMKSNTGGIMTMGKGVVYATSMRQKLNTRSSTEKELVGIHDVLPQVIWTRYFIMSQGYEGTESTVVRILVI